MLERSLQTTTDKRDPFVSSSWEPLSSTCLLFYILLLHNKRRFLWDNHLRRIFEGERFLIEPGRLQRGRENDAEWQRDNVTESSFELSFFFLFYHLHTSKRISSKLRMVLRFNIFVFSGLLLASVMASAIKPRDQPNPTLPTSLPFQNKEFTSGDLSEYAGLFTSSVSL